MRRPQGRGLALGAAAIGVGYAAERLLARRLRGAPGRAGLQSAPGRAGGGVATGGVLEHLDLHDAVLVGHSMGGMVIMRLCIDAPSVTRERVAGIVLVSTAAGSLLMPYGLAALARVTVPAARRGGAWLGRVPAGRLLPASDAAFLVTRAGLGRHADPTHVELTRTLMSATSPRAIGESFKSIVDHDVREALSEVDVPALVVVGTHDLLTPPRLAKEVVRHLAHAELVSLPGVGHMPMLEARVELHRVIADFASKLP